MTKEEAINILEKTKKWEFVPDSILDEALDMAIKALERSTGKWLKKEDKDETDEDITVWWYECSECGKQPLKGKYGREVLSDYCPFCGVRMESEVKA